MQFHPPKVVIIGQSEADQVEEQLQNLVDHMKGAHMQQWRESVAAGALLANFLCVAHFNVDARLRRRCIEVAAGVSRMVARKLTDDDIGQQVNRLFGDGEPGPKAVAGLLEQMRDYLYYQDVFLAVGSPGAAPAGELA